MATRPRRGFGGAADLAVSAGSIAGSAATPAIAGSLASSGLIAGSLAVPVVGAAIAGIALAVEAWIHRRGPVQKVQTTKIVNEAEPYLQQNLTAYLAGPRTVTNQQAALQTFDLIWQRVVDECSQAQFGEPGQRCVSDRQRGSTKGYDWFALYRDPIANDTQVVADAPSLLSFGSSAGLTETVGTHPELLIGALLLALAAAS